MLDIIDCIIKGENVEDKIEQLLNHKDYEFEFKRYEGRITKAEYKNYLLHCQKLEEKDIKNQDLKQHHKYYLDLFSNLDYYYKKLEVFKKLLTLELIQDSLSLAKKGLPDDIDVSQIDFVFTIGIGMSFGYVLGDVTHYDFLRLSKETSLEDFFSTLAHEMHHVCMNHIFPEELTPLELFIIFFSGEGLAVKYCNNAEGVISKKIYDKQPNIGLDDFSWKYLNQKFESAFKYYKQFIYDINSGKIDTNEKVREIIIKYFMNPYTDEQSHDAKPKLQQYLLYSLGNDLFGVIHDVFGKEKVFEVVKKPSEFIKTFNKAVSMIGRDDLII